MSRTRIDSAAGLRTRLEAGTSLEEVVFQGVDLVPFEAKLLQRNLRGSVFLGCRHTTDFAPAFARYGCLVVPRPEGLPYDPFRSKLYSPEELLRRFRPAQPASYHSTPDRLTHLSFMDPETGRPLESTVDETILRRLHDDSIREALEEFLGAQLVRGVVGVVGGLGESRAGELYREVALLCRDLTREGFLIVTRGGPGVAEAAHLGAYFAPYADDDLPSALRTIGQETAVGHEDSLTAPFKLRDQFPLEEPARACSVAVASWRQGCDVPCPFATHHAKYFEHSLAVEGLGRIAQHGLVAAALDSTSLVDFLRFAAQDHVSGLGAPQADRDLDRVGPQAAPLILFGSQPKEPPTAESPAEAPAEGVSDEAGPQAEPEPNQPSGSAPPRVCDAVALSAWRLAEAVSPDGAKRLLRTGDPAAVVAFLRSYEHAPR